MYVILGGGIAGLRRKLFGHESTMDGRCARNKPRCLRIYKLNLYKYNTLINP